MPCPIKRICWSKKRSRSTSALSKDTWSANRMLQSTLCSARNNKRISSNVPSMWTIGLKIWRQVQEINSWQKRKWRPPSLIFIWSQILPFLFLFLIILRSTWRCASRGRKLDDCSGSSRSRSALLSWTPTRNRSISPSKTQFVVTATIRLGRERSCERATSQVLAWPSASERICNYRVEWNINSPWRVRVVDCEQYFKTIKFWSGGEWRII